jgi:hypothetical protein
MVRTRIMWTHKTVEKGRCTDIRGTFMGGKIRMEKGSQLLEKFMKDDNNEVFENRNISFQEY